MQLDSRLHPLRLTVMMVACLCSLLWATSLAAQVQVEVYDEPVADLSSIAIPGAPAKLDLAADWLIVPYFEVDTTDPNGRTTLFSVRNLTDSSRTVFIQYYRQRPSTPVVEQQVTLGPKEVLPINIRAVSGQLPTDPDGVARGFVYAIDSQAVVSPFPLFVLSGDYFHIDPGNDFATGDRMLSFTSLHDTYDLCKEMEIRFLDGGAFSGGTDFLIFVNGPLGDGPSDPPTLLISVYSEAGGLPTMTMGVKTAQRAFRLDASSLLPAGSNFGVMEIRFNGAATGHITVTFSARGRFSVGLNALCVEPQLVG